MKGIILKPDLIKAIAGGRKTQTRRLDGLKEINQEPDTWELLGRDTSVLDGTMYFVFSRWSPNAKQVIAKPRYQVGEVVYVKEAFMIEQSEGLYEPTDRPFKNDYEWGLLIPHYKLTDPDPELYDDEDRQVKWCSPLFMPEWAARRFIKFTGVGAERLRLPLSPKELELEGGETALPILEKINGLWVIVYSFKRVEAEK